MTSTDGITIAFDQSGTGPALNFVNGATAIRRAGLIDEIHLDLAPVVLGRGVNQFGSLDAGAIRPKKTWHIMNSHRVRIIDPAQTDAETPDWRRTRAPE